MPARKFSAASAGYRYGFNGKELDKETLSTTTYDYGFRIYSPALGRFLSVDPLINKYPELTPYQFASNMPIIAVDVDGQEAKIVIINHGTAGQILWTSSTNQTITFLPSSIHIEIHKYYGYNADHKWTLLRTLPEYKIEKTGVDAQTGRIDLTKKSDLNLVFGKKVTPEFRTKVVETANNLRMDPNHLMTIMAFETGGTFSPSKKNAAGSSGTGLIQFMSSTAKKLGTTTKILSQMSAVDQLDYVQAYLSSYKGKLNTLEDAYMAVLWPKAVGKDLNYVMFTKYKTNTDGSKVESLEYKQNRGLDTDGDGEITKEEVSAVIRRKFSEGKKLKN